MAQAFLTHQYELKGDQGMYTHTPSKTMRALEIRTKSGKPITVLQSEDTPIAIESMLKENGWQIVSWNGLNIQLKAAPIAAVIPSKTSPGQKTQPSPKAGAIGCLVFFAIAVLLGSCAAIVGGGGEAKPKTGDMVTAEVKCQTAIKNQLNAPSTAKFSQQRGVENNSNNFIILGFVEAENRLGGIVGSTYRCEMTYEPTTDKWSADAKINK